MSASPFVSVPLPPAKEPEPQRWYVVLCDVALTDGITVAGAYHRLRPLDPTDPHTSPKAVIAALLATLTEEDLAEVFHAAADSVIAECNELRDRLAASLAAEQEMRSRVNELETEALSEQTRHNEQIATVRACIKRQADELVRAWPEANRYRDERDAANAEIDRLRASPFLLDEYEARNVLELLEAGQPFANTGDWCFQLFNRWRAIKWSHGPCQSVDWYREQMDGGAAATWLREVERQRGDIIRLERALAAEKQAHETTRAELTSGPNSLEAFLTKLRMLLDLSPVSDTVDVLSVVQHLKHTRDTAQKQAADLHNGNFQAELTELREVRADLATVRARVAELETQLSLDVSEQYEAGYTTAKANAEKRCANLQEDLDEARSQLEGAVEELRQYEEHDTDIRRKSESELATVREELTAFRPVIEAAKKFRKKCRANLDDYVVGGVVMINRGIEELELLQAVDSLGSEGDR